jgi:uncharacterized cupredoxin-like copper-binding protein
MMFRIAPVALVMLVALAGCADNAATPSQATSTSSHAGAPTSTAASASPAPSTPIAQTVEVRIEGGKISPPPGRVDVAQGSTLRLVVHSDRPDEVHVHGFDLTMEVGPGKPGTLTFTADRSGLFEVETHGSGKLLVQLAVR